MIEFHNLTYRYPKSTFCALSDVDASIGAGIHLLLGENGAGKTTLLHIIAGLLIPESGSLSLDGEAPCLRQPSLLQRIFFMPDTMVLPCKSVVGLEKIHAPLFPKFDGGLFRSNLQAFGLTGNETFADLSLGNRRKSVIAYALALNVDVLLLDEPANGLDITAKQVLQQMLASQISESQTLILSTHTVGDFEFLYDGLIMLSKGKLLLASSTWNISSSLQFTSSVVPPVEPLFMEQRLGLFRAISPANHAADGHVDFTLLYNALLSPARDNILSHIKNEADV